MPWVCGRIERDSIRISGGKAGPARNRGGNPAPTATLSLTEAPAPETEEHPLAANDEVSTLADAQLIALIVGDTVVVESSQTTVTPHRQSCPPLKLMRADEW